MRVRLVVVAFALLVAPVARAQSGLIVGVDDDLAKWLRSPRAPLSVERALGRSERVRNARDTRIGASNGGRGKMAGLIVRDRGWRRDTALDRGGRGKHDHRVCRSPLHRGAGGRADRLA